MLILLVSLFLSAVLGIVVALFSYARNTRAANCDRMGASIRFDQIWMTAAIPLSLAVGLLPGVAWWWDMFALASMYALDMPVKLSWDWILATVRHHAG